MTMSNSEIISRWKNGAFKPKEMVQVIADLNGCRKKDIVRILFEEKQLSAQAIYHYRKSGELECTDAEAKEFSNTADQPKKAEKPKKEKNVPAEKKINSELKIIKPPAPVIECAEAYLEDYSEKYNEAILLINEYEEVRAWLEAVKDE